MCTTGTNILLITAIGVGHKPKVCDLILKQGIPIDDTNTFGANALLQLFGTSI
jgi:hypothetical protein